MECVTVGGYPADGDRGEGGGGDHQIEWWRWCHLALQTIMIMYIFQTSSITASVNADKIFLVPQLL